MSLSKIYICVFKIGGPTVISFSLSRFCTFDKTVISLGPYMLYIVISSDKARKSFTNFSGRGSPPNTMFLTCAKAVSGSRLS